MFFIWEKFVDGSIEILRDPEPDLNDGGTGTGTKKMKLMNDGDEIEIQEKMRKSTGYELFIVLNSFTCVVT